MGRLIPIEDLDPNPFQPRRDLGDLSELTASIREKGVLEPILVRPQAGRYEIIAGERRFRAASEAGLDEIPCVIRPTSDAELLELALVENLQRRDLSPFEEADGLKTLSESYAYTHEVMAEKLGKSRSSITETLALAAMPEPVREQCRRADLSSKSLLLQVVRQPSPEKMLALVGQLRPGATRDQARRLARDSRKRPGRPRNYVFRYQPRERGFRLTLEFGCATVSRDEVARALRQALAEVEAAEVA